MLSIDIKKNDQIYLKQQMIVTLQRKFCMPTEQIFQMAQTKSDWLLVTYLGQF